MKIIEKILKFKDLLLDGLYPDKFKCILCGKDLNCDGFFCEQCLENKEDEIFNIGHKCQICDMKIKNDNKICDHCKDKLSHKSLYFKKCFCPLNYSRKVRSAILKLKSDNGKFLLKPFSKLIVNRLNDEKDLNIDFVTFVPSHKKTIKKRGYNQSKLLAEEISSLLNIPLIETLEKNVLTKTQKNLDYTTRQENLRDSMRLLIDKNLIKDKNILLVDDIVTTGATVNTCANLLSKAKNVYVCAIARNQIN